MLDLYLVPIMAVLVILLSLTTLVYLFKLFTSSKDSPDLSAVDLIKDAQNKANHIIMQAIKGAHSILVRAELSGIKEIAKEKFESRKLDEQYEKQLAALTSSLLSNLNQAAQRQMQEYENHSLKLRNQLEASFSYSEKKYSEQIAKLLEEERVSFNSLSNQIKEQIKREIEEEMTKAKAVVAEYKKSRFRAVEENLKTIVSDTVLKVAGKKISLEDQTDLVLQALDEAKAENFLN